MNDNEKLVVNAEQFEALQNISHRTMQELPHAANRRHDYRETLHWIIHGGPGKGKSHVIKQNKELFRDVLHWDMGVEYQVVALQAVMAEHLDGDTIHHACGIPVFSRAVSVENQAQRQIDVAK